MKRRYKLSHIAEVINHLAEIVHQDAIKNGWHDTPQEDGTKIASIFMEIAEAGEVLRIDPDMRSKHIPEHSALGEEYGDATLRMFDDAARRNIPIGDVIIAKLLYNRHRPDHKPENRAKPNGKKW